MLINKSKQLLIVVSVLFFVLLIVGGVVFFFLVRNNDDSTDEVSKSNTPCSVREKGGILSEAASLFLASNVLSQDPNERAEKIIALGNKILEQDNYENDANCLHILTQVYLNRSDSVNAEINLEKLKKIIAEENPESYILDENVNFLSIQDMEKSIEAINYNIQLYQQNNQRSDSGFENE